jgi:hypothetical protein
MSIVLQPDFPPPLENNIPLNLYDHQTFSIVIPLPASQNSQPLNFFIRPATASLVTILSSSCLDKVVGLFSFASPAPSSDLVHFFLDQVLLYKFSVDITRRWCKQSAVFARRSSLPFRQASS